MNRCVLLTLGVCLLGGCASNGLAANGPAASSSRRSKLQISTTSLPSGMVGSPYNTQLLAGGGTPPYAWSVTNDALPAGLSLNGSTGVIAGTPTEAVNASSLTFTVSDSSRPPQTKSVSLSLTIAPLPAPLALTTTSLPAGQVGTSYSASLAATGGKTPYTWSVSSGALPAAITLSSGGQLSGTPKTQGTFALTFQVNDSSSPQESATATLSLQINGSGNGSSSAFYGSGIDSDALSNIRVGPIPGVSFRFQATHTGTLSQLHFYLIVNAPKSGYNAGTGGTLLIQMEAARTIPPALS